MDGCSGIITTENTDQTSPNCKSAMSNMVMYSGHLGMHIQAPSKVEDWGSR